MLIGIPNLNQICLNKTQPRFQNFSILNVGWIMQFYMWSASVGMYGKSRDGAPPSIRERQIFSQRLLYSGRGDNTAKIKWRVKNNTSGTGKKASMLKGGWFRLLSVRWSVWKARSRSSLREIWVSMNDLISHRGIAGVFRALLAPEAICSLFTTRATVPQRETRATLAGALELPAHRLSVSHRAS